MTLTSTDCNEIIVVSTLIDDFQAAPGSYNKITISGTHNSGSEFSYEFTSAISSSGDYVQSDNDIHTILPAFYEQTVLVDGIYKVVVSLEYTDEVATQEQACIFKDCSSLKCDITDKDGLYYYYVLTNTCSCNCSKLYTIYEALLTQLETSTSNESDCGCV